MKVGDICYYMGYHGIESGIIINILNNNNIEIKGKCENYKVYRKNNDIYESKEELLNALQEETKERRRRYRSEIKNTEDLVIFAYKHELKGEYIDEDALIVFKEKCKEYNIRI